MKSKTGGIKINGRKVHSIRFANDIVLLTESQDDMNKVLNILADIFDRYQFED